MLISGTSTYLERFLILQREAASYILDSVTARPHRILETHHLSSTTFDIHFTS